MTSLLIPSFTPFLPRVWSRSPVRWASLALLLVTIAIRLGQIGNPIAGLDDQFYLLVGDRLWTGALPYRNIWDRKPAGLFLLYAAIRALPGDGIVAYQLVGTLFLGLTGVVATRMTARALPLRVAFVTGLAIVCYGVLLGAGFGEAPIFYDLMTVVAGACVLAVRERPGMRTLDPRAMAAMLLCGIALTLKTSAVFESCCFGLLLVHHDWRRGLRRRVRVGNIAVYLALGLGPTLAITAFYAVVGEWQAFAFANFHSAFMRSGGATPDSAGRLIGLLLILAPLIVPAAVEWRHISGERRIVLGCWLVAGVLSFVAIGRFYEHYALPLVTPLALTAAYGFRRPLVAALPCTLAVVMVVGGWWQFGDARERDIADVAALRQALPASVRERCLLVYEGPTILYHLSGACLSGRYAFPGHFTEPEEDGALERPMIDVLRLALAYRPAAIVSVPELRQGGARTPNDRLLAETLARIYRPIATQSIRLYGNRRVKAVIWQRR